MYWKLKMTTSEMEIFDGLMLGDGCLERPGSSTENVRMTFCLKYDNFAKSISGNLKSLPWRPIKPYDIYDHRTKKTYYGVSLRTRRCEFLRKQRIRWYPNGTKTVPADVSITPSTLMWWYLSDGCLMTNKGRPNARRISLATNSFSMIEIELLIRKLKNILGSNVYEENSTIIISGASICKFSNLVGRTSPASCYQYKFDFGQYLDVDYKEKSYAKRPSVVNFGERMKRANSKRIMCVETGEIFSSLTEAAKAVGRVVGAIGFAVNSGSCCCGKHWVRA